MDRAEYFQLMSAHEEAIHDLYSEYAEKFPEYASFWSDMASDEKRHAGIIRGLWKKICDTSIFIDEKKFRMYSVKMSVSYIKDRAIEARNVKITMQKALSIAKDIENALIETSFSDSLSGNSSEMIKILDLLADETRKHAQKINTLWNQIKEK